LGVSPNATALVAGRFAPVGLGSDLENWLDKSSGKPWLNLHQFPFMSAMPGPRGLGLFVSAPVHHAEAVNV